MSDPLSTVEAAAALGLTRSAVSRRCKTNQIEATKNDAGEWRIPESEIRRIRNERWEKYGSTDRLRYPA